jgi:hypothetical protein
MKTMLYHNIIRTALLSMLFLVPHTVIGQDASTSSYTEKFVDASGINLHYLDFGGTGLPVTDDALIKADRSLLMNEAIERAFGSNLKTVTLELPSNITTDEEYDAYWKESLSDIYFNAMIAFINQIPN